MVTPLPRLRVSNASSRPDTEPLASRCVINANTELKRVSTQIMPASFGPHQRMPSHRLSAELGGGAEVGDQPDIVEPRPPAPFHFGVDRLGVRTIVIMDRFYADRNRRLPGEFDVDIPDG